MEDSLYGAAVPIPFMGTGAPDGELEAGVLIALVRTLRTIAHRLDRQETDSEQTGRFRRVTKRVVTLSIGLHDGGHQADVATHA